MNEYKNGEALLKVSILQRLSRSVSNKQIKRVDEFLFEMTFCTQVNIMLLLMLYMF